MAQVVRELCIQTATVEIFLTDAWMAAWEEIDYRQLGSLLNVTGDFSNFASKNFAWKNVAERDEPEMIVRRDLLSPINW